MDKSKKYLNLIGLATKAGKIVRGAQLCTEAIKKETVYIVFIAKDASEKTTKPIKILAEKHNIPSLSIIDRETLGKYTGKDNISVAAIKDKGFADKIVQLEKENKISVEE